MMSEAACKAAACLAQCLYGIINVAVREFVDGISNLAANNQFSDRQNVKLAKLAIEFEKEIERRNKRDLEFQAAIKAITGINTVDD